MKREKDDEKYTGPIFPRLNVNDKEIGGPRAPPRNKMALYEQLSIPSQRFNNTTPPPPPSSFAPPASSAQGSGQDRGLFFPLNLPKSTPLAENSYARANRNTSSTQRATKDKLDEQDFTVPIFFQPEGGLAHGTNPNSGDRGINPSSGPAYLAHSMNLPSPGYKDPKQNKNTDFFSRQEGNKQSKENSRDLLAVADLSARSFKNSLARKDTEAPLKHSEPSAEHEPRDTSLCNIVRGNGVLNEPMMSIQNRYSSILAKDSSLVELRRPRNPTTDIGRHDEELLGPIQTGNGDRGDDDASETSMLDSITALDISPDDVVGVIGQKQFWKARKAIVHQQRAFAVQVFELHRLVKVQKSIAGEPHLMLEDSAYLAGSLKVSSTKKPLLEYIVKPPSHIVKQKENIEEANNKLEQSAENADAETSPSVQDTTQPYTNRHVSGNPSSVPEFNNGFQQAPGHQWLIPVMSPSEGLIYKPYTGHGFPPGPFFGGSVPQVANPVMGNFVNPAYNFMASQHHNQGNGFPPDPHQSGYHGYFSPYGMPIMNPQANSFSAHGQAGWFSGSQGQQPGTSFMGSQGQPGPFSGSSHGQMGRFTGAESYPNLPKPSTGSVPTSSKNGAIPDVAAYKGFTGTESNPNWPQPSTGSVQTSKNRAIPDVAEVRTAYKEKELQGSTASSPGGEARRPRESSSGGGRSAALNLFPTSIADHHQAQEVQTRAIKVVPHNALSATESAARIFQSIQEGRKHHD